MLLRPPGALKTASLCSAVLAGPAFGPRAPTTSRAAVDQECVQQFPSCCKRRRCGRSCVSGGTDYPFSTGTRWRIALVGGRATYRKCRSCCSCTRFRKRLPSQSSATFGRGLRSPTSSRTSRQSIGRQGLADAVGVVDQAGQAMVMVAMVQCTSWWMGQRQGLKGKWKASCIT